MIDCWLIFSLLKPFVDIIVQTYMHTLKENYKEEIKARQASTQKWNIRESWVKEKQKWKICLTFQRVIYPIFFTVFILIFWLVGLVHYARF